MNKEFHDFWDNDDPDDDWKKDGDYPWQQYDKDSNFGEIPNTKSSGVWILKCCLCNNSIMLPNDVVEAKDDYKGFKEYIQGLGWYVRHIWKDNAMSVYCYCPDCESKA